MEFRVLGPLEVLEDDRSLPLGGAKQRALLALLLLNANRVVSHERLIDNLWDADPPATARATVQVYISRLRKLLSADALVTRGAGYALEVDPDALDLARFERLRAEGRFHEALALWRGPPLASRSCMWRRSRSASTPTSAAAVTPSSSPSSRSWSPSIHIASASAAS